MNFKIGDRVKILPTGQEAVIKSTHGYHFLYGALYKTDDHSFGYWADELQLIESKKKHHPLTKIFLDEPVVIC